MNQKTLMLGLRTVALAQRPASGERPVSGATAAHLARINAMPGVLQPLAESDIYVRSMLALNSQVLHNGFQFPNEELAKVAELARAPGGVPVQCNHDTYGGIGSLPVATVFGGALITEAGVVHVEMPFYLLAGTVGDDVTTRIDGGVIREVSVQVGFDHLECSICTQHMGDCRHWPLQVYNGLTALGFVRGVKVLYEVSLVYAGMAKDTRIRMAASAERIGAVDVEQLLAAQRGPGPLFDPPSPGPEQAVEFLYHTQ